MTVVEGDPKAPFSIATTPRCRGGRYSFPANDPLYPWSFIMLSVKQGSIKYRFWVFGMTQPGIGPWSRGPWANTLTILPMSGLYIYIYIYIWERESSTDRSVSFYQNSLVWLDGLDSRSWDRKPVDSNANPRFYHEETSASEVNLNGYESQLLLFTYFRLTATESSIHTRSLAYTLMATQFLHSLYL